MHCSLKNAFTLALAVCCMWNTRKSDTPLGGSMCDSRFSTDSHCLQTNLGDILYAGEHHMYR